MAKSNPAFGPTCPFGGDWYACGNGTQFTGCCTVDACTEVGCVAGNLRAASFNAASYGTFPDQQCELGSWYTCTFKDGTPSFMGCCTGNPCQQKGCPASQLKAGLLSANPAIANKFDPQPPLAGSSSSISSSSSSTSAQATSTSTSTASSVNSAAATATGSNTLPQPQTLSTGTIAGAAAGGALAVIIVGLLIGFFMRRRRRNNGTYRPQTANAHFSEKGWPTPSTSTYSPYLNSTNKLPQYSAVPTSPPQEAMDTPVPQIYEAASREVSYGQYSPYLSQQNSPGMSQYSPVWGSDRMSGAVSTTGTATTGLGVRGVAGNSEDRRAELDSGR